MPFLPPSLTSNMLSAAVLLSGFSTLKAPLIAEAGSLPTAHHFLSVSLCLSVGLREVLCRSRGAIFPVKFKSGLSVSVNFTFESPTPTNQQLTASFFKTKHKIMSRATSFLWGYLTCPGQKGYVSTDEVLSKLVVMELLLVRGIRAIYLPWLVWLLAHPSKGFF